MIKNIVFLALAAGLLWNTVQIWNLSQQIHGNQEIAERAIANNLFSDADLANRIDRIEKQTNNILQ